jgi:thiosulfate dehydrogenase
MKAKDQMNETEKAIIQLSRTTAIIAVFFVLIVGVFISVIIDSKSGDPIKIFSSNKPVIDAAATVIAATTTENEAPVDNTWKAPDESTIPAGKEGEEIIYGKDIIANTAKYFGPNGKVKAISNGMNCQNCHNEAGAKPWGNNYSAVYSTYPKFRSRSGTKESIVKRINDCFERSLNGKPVDSTTREMKAMIAYIKWLGKDVKKGEKPE